MTKRLLHWALALWLFSLSLAASADVFRPAYLELRERAEGRYDVLWKVPVDLRFVVRRERRWVRSARGSGK